MASFDDLTKNLLPQMDYLRDMNIRVRDYKAEMMADMSRAMHSIKSAPQVHAENVQTAIRSHIENLQAALNDNEELLVYHGTGLEFIRVLEVGLPNHHVLILVGHDMQGNAASCIVNVSAVHLTCKVVKVQQPATPKRIGFIVPEPS